MIGNLTGLEKTWISNEIAEFLSQILPFPPRLQGPGNGTFKTAEKNYTAEELHQRKILLAEYLLMWLAENFPDGHPILTLLNSKNVKSIDQEFLGKATRIINEHLSDSTFGIEEFAAEMAVSRSQLFRRFITLTGKCPSDFIRCIRLMRAARLIEKNFGNITEIAMEVGYSNLAHFTGCFRAHFGILPSEYAKRFHGN